MLLKKLTIQSLLSFSESPCEVPLRNLNVLIGPNGSGKSNFIEVVEVLRASTNDIGNPIRMNGGISEWLWKGQPTGHRVGFIEAQVVWDRVFHKDTICHHLSLAEGQSLIAAESLKASSTTAVGDEAREIYSYGTEFVRPIKPVIVTETGRVEIPPSDFDRRRSILAQRRDPQRFPEITFLADEYERIQIYREWGFGRTTAPRLAQKATDRNDRLSEDFSNLGMMLNRLRQVSETKLRFLEMLNKLYPNIDDFDVSVEGGTVQVFFQESKFTIPATRLSDGTLRYLCLLVILLQPSPPPLVCIEEPELGLHPDVLPGLADLLVEASQRMQLVVTTHSDLIVDALSDTPEDIIICEKLEGATTMRRLDREGLSHWLNEYSLGELWRSGQLGGNRW